MAPTTVWAMGGGGAAHARSRSAQDGIPLQAGIRATLGFSRCMRAVLEAVLGAGGSPRQGAAHSDNVSETNPNFS